MDCEYIGPVTEAERDRIARILRACGGPGRVISLPRWTVFKEKVGSRCVFLVVDNHTGHTCRGRTVSALIEMLKRGYDPPA